MGRRWSSTTGPTRFDSRVRCRSEPRFETLQCSPRLKSCRTVHYRVRSPTPSRSKAWANLPSLRRPSRESCSEILQEESRLHMNLELTTEEVAFREEMRKFFTTEFSPELRARAAGFGKLTREDIVAGQQILNAHGLAVPHWPVEW